MKDEGTNEIQTKCNKTTLWICKMNFKIIHENVYNIVKGDAIL